MFLRSLFLICILTMTSALSAQRAKVAYYDTEKPVKESWDQFTKAMLQEISDNPLVTEAFLNDCAYLKGKESRMKPLTEDAKATLKLWAKKEVSEMKIAPPSGQKWTPSNLTEAAKKRLVEAAAEVRVHFYAPYSKFPVGAALLTSDGSIYLGCNVENAAYGSTICAERGAIMNIVSRINRGNSLELSADIVAVAIVLRTGGSPCGACRQVLYEFNPRMLVIMRDIDGVSGQEAILKDLLPLGFGPENLR